MTVRDFCDWLGATPLSNWEKNTVWFVPAVQTVHILCVALVISSAMMVNLRLINTIGRDTPASEYVRRFEPWIWWSVLVLFTTGALLTIAEPGRELINNVFRLKMILLIVALIISWFLYRANRREFSLPKRVQYTLAVTSLCLWVSIIFAGRWIAYVVYG